MTNHGKNVPAQTFPEMVETGLEKKSSSSLYKRDAAEFVDQQLSALIGKTTAELVEVATAEPVSLKDTAEVKRRTVLYLKACEETSTIPSMTGLARSMGLSRQALYDVCWRGEPQDTAQWLTLCRDAFSDVLAQASLRNSCNGVVGIFLQKALYGLRETTEIIAKREDNGPLGPLVDRRELEAKIAADVIIDED